MMKKKVKVTYNFNYKKTPIRVGDQVKILSGNDKNKTGAILEFNRKKGLVKVSGIAMRSHFVKAKDNHNVPKIEKKEGFIAVSKVMLINSDGVASRVRKSKNGKNVDRIFIKTNETIIGVNKLINKVEDENVTK